MNGFAVEHTSHLHGLAEITIIIENDRLEIEVKSPAINLVGFENKARTPKHIEAVNKAELLLSNLKEIFLFSNGHCKLINKSIDLSQINITHHHSDHRYTAHDSFNQQIAIADTVIGNKMDVYRDKEKLIN
jgi:G3E family GTPase